MGFCVLGPERMLTVPPFTLTMFWARACVLTVVAKVAPSSSNISERRERDVWVILVFSFPHRLNQNQRHGKAVGRKSSCLARSAARGSPAGAPEAPEVLLHAPQHRVGFEGPAPTLLR
jgi:hypothetical protein